MPASLAAMSVALIAFGLSRLSLPGTLGDFAAVASVGLFGGAVGIAVSMLVGRWIVREKRRRTPVELAFVSSNSVSEDSDRVLREWQPKFARDGFHLITQQVISIHELPHWNYFRKWPTRVALIQNITMDG